MEKHFDINEDSRSIRCRMIISNKDKQTRTFSHVVIVTHGFGSNKETTGTTKFGEHITAKYKGFAVLAFDWPCHGNDARKKLTITECLAYLQIVTNYARNTLDAKDLYIYASSFGGYITLRYLLESGNPFRKIALRCPAIRMHDTLESAIPDADKAKLKKGKDILVGFTRKMKIDQLFLKDMAALKTTNTSTSRKTFSSFMERKTRSCPLRSQKHLQKTISSTSSLWKMRTILFKITTTWHLPFTRSSNSSSQKINEGVPFRLYFTPAKRRTGKCL